MSEKKFSERDVVNKIIGEIQPIGETYTDDKRFENLKVMCDLVDGLISEIATTASYATAHEYSMKRAGEYADSFLKEIVKELPQS